MFLILLMSEDVKKYKYKYMEGKMDEEKKETKIKQPKKAVKVVAIIVAIIAVIAIILGVLAATGKINLNFSKKSKMVSGIEKLGEAYTKPLENLSESAEKNNLEVKLFNNLEKDSAIEASTEISANIDTLDVDGLTSSEKSAVKSIVDLVNKAKIATNIRYDGNKSAYMKIDGNLDDVKVSGEALYDGSQAALRSEEINSKWITISEDDLKDLADENGLDLDDLKDTISESMNQVSKITKSIEIDEKTQKEINERYSKVLKEYVNSKSKEIKSEKDKIEVDGKEKKCTKLTLKLNEKDIKKLAKNYLDTFAKDDQLKEILTNTAESYAEIMKKAGEDSTAEEITDAIDELYNNIDKIKEEIDDADFQADIKLIVYGSNTNIYRTDIVINIEGAEVSLETTFNKEDTTTVISVDYQGVSAEIATITVKEEKNGVSLKIEASKFIKEQLNQKSSDNVSLEIKYTTEKSKSEIALEVNAGSYGNGTLTISSNATTNEDKEYADNTVVSIDVDAPDYVTAKMSMTMKNSIKIGGVSIPKVSSSESIDIKDEEALQQYQKEAQTKLEKLLEDLQSIEALKSIIENEF